MRKRFGIFVMHDADGLVGSYKEFLLNDIIENLAELIIVCNGVLLEEELEKLRKFTRRIHTRENRGYDAGAIKAALCEYTNQNELRDYDEIVIFNDSFYGPLYPFNRIFSEMDTRAVDFWGITRQYGNDSNYVIQTYFYTVNQKMACSDEFIDFWSNLDTNFKSFEDAVFKYEFIFTQHFEALGFKWDVYTDTSKYENIDINYPMHISHLLLTESNLPVIKRRTLVGLEKWNEPKANDFTYFTTERAAEIMKFIKQHSQYDVNYIWDDLLRRCSVTELIYSLNLYYILPVDTSELQSINNSKIAVVIYIENLFSVDVCVKSVKKLPANVAIHIIIENQVIYNELIKKLPVAEHDNTHIKLVNEQKDKSTIEYESFCEQLHEYDYICYLNDSFCNEYKSNFQMWFPTIQSIWHNTLAGFEYIKNVIDTFESNPKLGLISTPLPFTDRYFKSQRYIGEKASLSVPSLLKIIGVDVKPEMFNQFDLNINAFWCRTAALRQLCEYSELISNSAHETFAKNYEINSIFPYIAQHEGYYTGVLMSIEYASMELRNKTTSLFAICDKLNKDLLYNDSSIKSVIDYVGRIAQGLPVYLYGAGKVGKYYFDALQKRGVVISGFIVSDGYKNSEQYMGCPVYELSSLIGERSNLYVVMAVGNQLYQEVRDTLEKSGFNNIIDL